MNKTECILREHSARMNKNSTGCPASEKSDVWQAGIFMHKNKPVSYNELKETGGGIWKI